MANDHRPLEHFATSALLRELEHRADGWPNLRAIKRWCDDCTHFRHATSESDQRNPCTRGHTMSFRVPEEFNYTNPEAWGFYRRNCGDWCRRPEPDVVTPNPAIPLIPPAPPPRPPRSSRPRKTK